MFVTTTTTATLDTDREETPDHVAHDATTGEVLQPIAPTSPDLIEIRDGLRALGYATGRDACEFLSARFDRPIKRLGELTEIEVTSMLTEIRATVAELEVVL
jgi:hypothetical protein